MSDTPRTDAAIDDSYRGFVGVNFTRQLERELANLRAELAFARAQLDHLIYDITHCPGQTQPTHRRVRKGCGLIFSSLVNAVDGSKQ